MTVSIFNHYDFFLQIITIFAFATVAGFVGRFQFTVNCLQKPTFGGPPTREVKGDFFYPFNDVTIYAYVSDEKMCKNETKKVVEEYSVDINYKSEAEYFVFTGVVSMLFVIIAAVYYVFFEDRAKDATSTDVGLFSFPVVVRLLLLFDNFRGRVMYYIVWFQKIPIPYTDGFGGLSPPPNPPKILV